jgi:hypothetical protein
MIAGVIVTAGDKLLPVSLAPVIITGTGGAIYRHWWRNLPALVAEFTGTGGVYLPALVAQCVKGLLPR